MHRRRSFVGCFILSFLLSAGSACSSDSSSEPGCEQVPSDYCEAHRSKFCSLMEACFGGAGNDYQSCMSDCSNSGKWCEDSRAFDQCVQSALLCEEFKSCSGGSTGVGGAGTGGAGTGGSGTGGTATGTLCAYTTSTTSICSGEPQTTSPPKQHCEVRAKCENDTVTNCRGGCCATIYFTNSKVVTSC